MKPEINRTSPIGIFDSGIGGLTVAKAVMEHLPNEHIIYFGDTARVPYGIKSQENVRLYSSQIARFLTAKGVKMIIIACNTASAAAYTAVQHSSNGIPVINVIEAGTSEAARSGKRVIGVIGTLGTIGSGAYEKSLLQANPDLVVKSLACPMLVPLAEEGWTDNEIAQKTLDVYLRPFKSNGVEALILGCTHYPLFKKAIAGYFQEKNMHVIDSAEAIAGMAKQRLSGLELLNNSSVKGKLSCYVSDRPQRFHELAERFLGREPEHVSIESLLD